jgi:hypothetical protein
MKTKDVSIEWNGGKETVTIKRLTFGEMNAVSEEALTVRMLNGQPNVDVSQMKLKEIGLLKGIVKAPFPITIDSIRNLEMEVGNALFEAFSELNEQSPTKKDA